MTYFNKSFILTKQAVLYLQLQKFVKTKTSNQYLGYVKDQSDTQEQITDQDKYEEILYSQSTL